MALQFRTAKTWITKRVTPDYTNQLDLFSEATLGASRALPTSPARTAGRVPATPRPQQLGFEVWEPLAPFDVAATTVCKPASLNTDADREPTPAQTPQPEIAARSRISPHTGISDRPNLSVEKVLDIEPEDKPSRDFRIAAAHRIGQGSLHEKARDNIAAIRLLKTL